MNLSLAERDRRYSAIRQQMYKSKLDSLLIIGRGDYMNRGNIRYVTGYGINVGEQYCIFPATGKPVFVGPPTNALPKIIKAGWIDTIVASPYPLEKIAQELSRLDKGSRIGTIGIELIGVSDYKILSQFHDRFVDATGLFKQLRLIKSPEEIEKMRISASIGDKALSAVYRMLKPGVSDFEIYGEVKGIIHRMGCEYSMEFIDAGGITTNIYHPTGDIVKANGILAMEITPSYDGYYTQLAVTLPVKKYPPDIQKMMSVWEEALNAGVDTMRTGIKASDVYRTISKVISRHGYSSFWRGGHGIGLDVVDFVSLTDADDTELKSGMTFVLHPGVKSDAQGKGVFMGYTYLLTDSGVEKLNKVNVPIC